MTEDQTPSHYRRIVSFVKREGRLTKGQLRALNELYPQFTVPLDINPDQPIDFATVFGNTNPVIMEIGFGNGQSLTSMAQANPDYNYLGLEVHRPGVGNVLLQIEQLGLTNVRVLNHDAVEVLQHSIANAALQHVMIFFPDPWHKKRHNKRRIIQPDFVMLLAQKIRPGGILHLATDWQDYAEHMLAVLEQSSEFMNEQGKNNYTPRPDYRPLTKFEQRGKRLGHGVWDLLYKRV